MKALTRQMAPKNANTVVITFSKWAKCGIILKNLNFREISY